MRGMKGQAAIEFLMTYGWAIMAVLVMIGAMSYLGLLSPSAFLPEKCEIVVGFTCTDFQVTRNEVTLNLINALGDEAKIEKVEIINPENPTSPACSKTLESSVSTVSNGGKISVTGIACKPDLPFSVGDKANVKIVITYSKKIADKFPFSHAVAGVLYARVGETAVSPPSGIGMPSSPYIPGSS